MVAKLKLIQKYFKNVVFLTTWIGQKMIIYLQRVLMRGQTQQKLMIMSQYKKLKSNKKLHRVICFK